GGVDVGALLQGTRHQRRPFFVRRRTMYWLEAFFLLRVRPSGLPQGLTGWRPPDDLPSPPPRGWSIGFMATPRVWGRTPFQRLRPAFPSLIRSASTLPTWPAVARQSSGTWRISPEGSRSRAMSPSFDISCTAAPADRAILAPPPGRSSMA